MTTVFVDHGVTPEHHCKFNGACYGEICIANELCLKTDEELSAEEKEYISQFNSEGGSSGHFEEFRSEPCDDCKSWEDCEMNGRLIQQGYSIS